MENMQSFNMRGELLSNHVMESSSSFDESNNFRNDTALFEKFLIDEMDLYMDDIRNGVIISRMVSDAVIKGMVSAISEESAEKMAAKEEEVAFLNERLQFYECNMHIEKEAGLGFTVSTGRKKDTSKPRFNYVGVEQSHAAEHLFGLKIAADEQILMLKKEALDLKGCKLTNYINLGETQRGKMLQKEAEIDKGIDALEGLLDAIYKQIDNLFFATEVPLYEVQREYEFREDVNLMVFQSIIKCLREEFEEKSLQQSSIFSKQHKNLMVNLEELSSLRHELDAISSSLLVPEPGKLPSHGSHEVVDERSNIERKDRIHLKALENHLSQPSLQEENGAVASEKPEESKSRVLDTTDSLQHMSKDKLISYFKDEITKMKRNHELTVQEKTEECYRLKREYLKEKDPFNWKKDKEFDALRKKIPEVIMKLDNILLENETSFEFYDGEYIKNLNVKAENLDFQNQHLQKEVNRLSLQVSDAASKISHLSLMETNLLHQIKKLECDIEDANVDFFFREEVYKSILKGLNDKTKYGMEGADIEYFFANEICIIVFREFIKNAEAAIGCMTMRFLEEWIHRTYLEAMLLVCVKSLLSKAEENEKLKLEITLMKEKETSSIEVRVKFKEQFDLACIELEMLRNQMSEQERLLDESKKESDLMMSKLKVELEHKDWLIEQTRQREKDIHCMNAELSNRLEEETRQKIVLDEKLKDALDMVKETERQKSKFYGIIVENESIISAAIEKELDQQMRMEVVVFSLQELSTSLIDFESKVMDTMLLHTARLEIANHKFRQLFQQANSIKAKMFVYRRGLELRCSDLQKAEVEVDLLGDQVDMLQSLLQEIYTKLDRYLHILQHYPGIVETLVSIRSAIG